MLVTHDDDEDLLWQKLIDGIGEVLDYATQREVVLGFEPEPGMFVDTVSRAEELLKRLNYPKYLGLTIDIGHLECLGERPLEATVRLVADRIVNVHIDDMRVCRHEHLPLGKGDINFHPVLSELVASGYQGGLHVELPRQSHMWHKTAKESYEFMSNTLNGCFPVGFFCAAITLRIALPLWYYCRRMFAEFPLSCCGPLVTLQKNS